MKRYPGKKISTAVFISGRGSNLKNLLKFSKKKNSPIKIELVFSNNKNAVGLNYAKLNKINTLFLSSKKFDVLEKKLLKVLQKKNIKFICLAGFMKVLTTNFITNFKGKIINIHPSLLPKYKGLNTHQRVLENNEIYTGCTVHFVSAKLDSGKIILQKKIRILKNDNIRRLSNRVLLEEHKLYPKAIMKILA
tara:strand:- start:1059 stop:1634 length:576 start_codon:yes stop_codon:yes gene_type:complete